MHSKYIPKCENLLHRKFNRLTAVGYAGVVTMSRRRARWLWRCDCGTYKLIVADHVKSGNTQSCGCLSIEVRHSRSMTHGMSHSIDYRIWLGMKQRCYDIHAIGFSDYGGRGIMICDRWRHSFENFHTDMGPRPTPKHSIDRIDNDGNYSCGHCPQCLSNQWLFNVRWATRLEQIRNRRNSKTLTLNGITRPVSEWCALTGLHYSTLAMRLTKYKWSVERAITTPARPKRA